MVHNAGILRDKTLLNMEESDWDLVQKVHSRGSFLCTRAAARVMKMNHGYNSKKGIPSVMDIADNIHKVLFDDADVQMGAAMQFD
jgi:NAD(P)-dependent dehydrogenase (short-subunit alcohol dehydrogenase family)